MTRLSAALALVAAALSAVRVLVATQKSESECQSSAVYENHNQVDYGPLKVHSVRGGSVVEIGDKVQAEQTVPGACLSLFTEERA